MRKYFAFAILSLTLLAGVCFAGQPPMPMEQPLGYSSDEGPNAASYLGVDTKDITPDRVASFHLKDEQGVEVTMVDQDAPAGKAGIKEHDVILSINGERVESVEQLRRLIHEIPSGRVITIGLSRDGQPQTLKTQLASRAQAFAFNSKDFHFQIPPIPPMPAIADMDLPVSVVVVHSAMRSGLMVENLTPQLSDFFGAKGGQGILVRSVEKGSLAEKAGFHAGDVIVRVNGESVGDSGDFGRLLRARKANNVSVGVLRDKKEQTLTFTMPDRQHSEKFSESFEIPEVSAVISAELSRHTAELDKIQPQIAMLMNQAEQVSAEKMQEAQKELQKAMSQAAKRPNLAEQAEITDESGHGARS